MIDYNVVEELVNWLKAEVKSANAKGVVFGISGGVDSSVVAGISKIAFEKSSLGIIMPCHSAKRDELDAKILAHTIDLNYEIVDLTESYDKIVCGTKFSENNLAKSNIKPRLRMTTLYYYAQMNNYLVLSGSNKSEYYLGYFTKYGDNAADLFPLLNFTKSEVYELAKLLKIPEKIINKKPSAGLLDGQTDEDDMGFSYYDLENYFNGVKIDEKIEKKIEKMHEASEHKRKVPNSFNMKGRDRNVRTFKVE